jgi:RNA polymerase sigma factor (sigma-70 family)
VVVRDRAFADFWHRSAPTVLEDAQTALGSMTEAEDVAQDVFYRVLRTARALQPSGAPHRFGVGLVNDVLRSELRRRQRLRALLLLPLGTKDAEDPHPADIESRDLLRRFSALLERLSPRHRRVFVLRRIEAMTISEIAAATRLSSSTVKRALAYASRRVSRWIESSRAQAP